MMQLAACAQLIFEFLRPPQKNVKWQRHFNTVEKSSQRLEMTTDADK